MARQEKLWNPAYLLLAVSNFFSWLSYNMVAPVITGYLQTLGASVFLCGIAGGIFAFTSCLSRPFSGVMSDRMNRKMLMGGFTMLMAVSLLLYSLVSNAVLILFFRGIHGIAAVLFPYENKKSSMPDGRKQDKRRLSLGQFAELKLIGLAGVNAAFTMMNGVVSAFLVVFAVQQGIEGVSWHFTLNAAVLIFSRIVLARKMNAWTLKQNLYPAFFCGIAALLLIGGADTLMMLLIAAAWVYFFMKEKNFF